MKKKITALLTGQALFTVLQAYLISKISLVGRVGIALFYHEYAVLRSFWKTFLLFFGFQLIVIAVLAFFRLRTSRKMTNLAAFALLAIAICGLIYTYNDFLHTYSHRLLKERFHLGFYLFWLGWIASCIFFLINVNSTQIEGPNLKDTEA